MYHGTLIMYHGTLAVYHGTLTVYHGTFSYGMADTCSKFIYIIKHRNITHIEYLSNTHEFVKLNILKLKDTVDHK